MDEPLAIDDDIRKEFDQCWAYVHQFFKLDTFKAVYWFYAPNPMLGNIRPMDLLIRRRGKLWKFVEAAKEGY